MPYLKLLDGWTKRIVVIDRLPADAVVAVSDPIPDTVYPAAITADPADSSKLRILDVPWLLEKDINSYLYGLDLGSTPLGSVCEILTLDAADLSVLDREALPVGRWVDLRDDGSVLWLANLNTGKFHTWSKTGAGEIATYGPTYTGLRAETRSNPVGVAINGSDLWLSFRGLWELWRVDVSAPTEVLQVVKTGGGGLDGPYMLDDATAPERTDYYCATGFLPAPRRGPWRYHPI